MPAARSDDLSITAFNSQLFSPDGAPLIDRARIDSATVARILQSLMTTPGAKGRGRERITYADLGVEQLGAVYERVLDYAPQLEVATAGSVLIQPARDARANVISARSHSDASHDVARSDARVALRNRTRPGVAQRHARATGAHGD